ncbi:hypothetical protein BDW42DRAFT_168650 [Aspergillus taichungensis]|uniref:Uncharacterized protein n=1 Tax=Aspergillus taichungensis TaxID=482145 RepID=A0A2J5HW06_9EURO|nr:hypothetical protein BDW42DRAFT_168650 [Aspergillus taichungensis]
MAAGKPRLHRLFAAFASNTIPSGFNWNDDGCLNLEVAFFNCQPCRYGSLVGSKCGRTFLPLAGPTRTLERGPADYIRRGVSEFRMMGGVQNEWSRLTCRMAFECLELSLKEQRGSACYRPRSIKRTHGPRPPRTTFIGRIVLVLGRLKSRLGHPDSFAR